MKKKSSNKAAPKNAPAPVASAVAKQDGEIPPGLENLAELKDLSPVQQLAMAIPKFGEALKTEKATEATEAFAGLFWGVGIDFRVPLPDWTKAASKKAWQAMGLNFLPDLATDPTAAGKLVELATLSPQKNNPTPIEQAVVNLIGYIKTESGNLTAEEQEKYVKGRKAVPKIIERLEEKTTNERVLAFLCIASQWREVEKLGSRNKTYQWLKKQKTPEGQLLISPQTEWDEVKDWLAEINLPKGKAGRPKAQIRTPAKSENPVFSKTPKSGL